MDDTCKNFYGDKNAYVFRRSHILKERKKLVDSMFSYQCWKYMFPSNMESGEIPRGISGIWARIFKRVWGPGIDSKEWIPPAYVAWRAGMIALFLLGS
jgi:hypothetical protein